MNPSAFGSLPASACALGTAGSYGPDRITYDTYDNVGQLLKITTGYGVSGTQRDEATYSWSNNGRQTSIKDANANLTTFVYDGFDRLVKTQLPSPTKGAGTSSTSDYEQLTLDASGNVIARRLRDGTSISYGYDALSRMTSKTLPSGEHAITYAYDNIGHPTAITGTTGLSYGWDALGRMTSETQAFGSVAYQYDLASRRTRLTWQDGTYLTYAYDDADEMASIKENGTTTLASFTYDDMGERKTRTLANGTSTTYGYDAVSRLTSLALGGGTSANTVTLSNYSPAGEIGARANSNDAFAWTAGANVNRAYTINGLNQFATIAGVTQGYDARGNLTSSGGTTYAYTSENLLKSVSGGYTLTYDPIGRLAEYDTPAATRFVYDGGMISEEVNSSGTVLRRYAFGPAGDEPIVWYEGSGTATKRYIDQDERGSITRVTDGAGATVAVNSYDEYGIPGSANQGRFGYTGQAWLPEIGLAYYKARMYSPTLGRFMQTDPVGYAAGPNWYNYVNGDPINLTDFNGMDPPPLNAADEIRVNGICSNAGPGWANFSGVCAMIPPGWFNLTNFMTGTTTSGGTRGSGEPAILGQRRPHLTCNGIPGFSQFEEAAASAIAENPTNSYTPAWLRGIFIHSAFSRLVMSFPGYGISSHVNVSYRDGVVAGWLDLGSVRPDAVSGSVDDPNFIVELKTSNARLDQAQLSNYHKNLPPNTQICEIYEIGI